MNSPFSIDSIKEPEKIRVLLYVNGNFAHVSLTEIIKPLQKKISSLEDKIKSLEAK